MQLTLGRIRNPVPAGVGGSTSSVFLRRATSQGAPRRAPVPVPSRSRQLLIDALVADAVHHEAQERCDLTATEVLGRKVLFETMYVTTKRMLKRMKEIKPPPAAVVVPRASMLSPNEVRKKITGPEKIARRAFEKEEHDAWTIFSLTSHIAMPRRALSRGSPKTVRDATPVFAPDVKSSHTALNTMILMAALKPGDVVYDVGCGDGELLHTIALKFPNSNAKVQNFPKR